MLPNYKVRLCIALQFISCTQNAFELCVQHFQLIFRVAQKSRASYNIARLFSVLHNNLRYFLRHIGLVYDATLQFNYMCSIIIRFLQSHFIKILHATLKWIFNVVQKSWVHITLQTAAFHIFIFISYCNFIMHETMQFS